MSLLIALTFFAMISFTVAVVVSIWLAIRYPDYPLIDKQKKAEENESDT